MKEKTKHRLKSVFIIVVFLVGLAIFLYPVLSDLWNRWRNEDLIVEYKDNIQNLQETDNKQYEEIWAKAKKYNKNHRQNYVIDPFTEAEDYEKSSDYNAQLNPNHDGIMGYLTIPKIDVGLVIYHGIGEEALEKGVGHTEGTSLPIGGKSTHSVLSAHSGLPSAKLFTDLDQLKIGDKFFIHVLNKTLAYEVDQIKIVLPDNVDVIKIVEGKDYSTLLTCTPYGVNSHRLCVRGERIPYGETAEDENNTEPSSKNKYYKLIFLGLGLLIVLYVISKMKKKDRNNTNE